MLRRASQVVRQVFRKQFNVPRFTSTQKGRYARKLLADVAEPGMKTSPEVAPFWKVFFDEAQKLDGVPGTGHHLPDIISRT